MKLLSMQVRISAYIDAYTPQCNYAFIQCAIMKLRVYASIYIFNCATMQLCYCASMHLHVCNYANTYLCDYATMELQAAKNNKRQAFLGVFKISHCYLRF